jgi:ABC-type nitrate/sulfonate/bicarbonate transport system substrate-binding protein
MPTSTTPSRGLRRAALAAVLLTASLVLGGCAGGAATSPTEAGSATETTPMTVQLSWIFNEEFAGEYAAEVNGYYEEAGLGPVQLVPGPSAGVPELVSGTADVAFSDAVSVGSAIANGGVPLKILGAVFQENPFTVLSLAEGANITEPSDLIGKRIGVQDGNAALFSALLAANGIDAAEVTVVPVQYDPAPLVNNEVDGFIAYVTNEPVALAAAGIPTTSLMFAEHGLPFVAKTVVASDETISENRQMLKSFLRAEIRGWADALLNLDETVALVTEEYGTDLELDPEIVRAGAEAQNALIVSSETEQNGLLTISAELQALTLASLAEAGIVVETSDLFDLSLIDEVYDEYPELLDLAS